MAISKIIIENYVKHLSPVNSIGELKVLRGSDKQKVLVSEIRQGEEYLKRQLPQFNYNLAVVAPMTETGRSEALKALKGCYDIGNTFAVDFDHLTKDELERLIKWFLDHKDEIGLAMIEVSAREAGLHVVLKRRFVEDMVWYRSKYEELVRENQIRNLEWISELCGAAYDRNAKDVQRVLYATTDSPEDLIYVNEEILFNSEPLNITFSEEPEEEEFPTDAVEIDFHESDELAEGFPVINHAEKLKDTIDNIIVPRGIDLTKPEKAWFKLANVCYNVLGPVEGRAYYHKLCKFYPEYSPAECNKKIDHCNGTYPYNYMTFENYLIEYFDNERFKH